MLKKTIKTKKFTRLAFLKVAAIKFKFSSFILFRLLGFQSR